MTNTEAFKKAIELIEDHRTKGWEGETPIGVFLTPQKIIWMWLRICDYYVANSEYPKSYRALNSWEKKYYENNM